MRRPRARAAGVAAVMAAGALPWAMGPASADNIGNEGCTPGYWKHPTNNWEEYTPNTKLGTLFTFPSSLSQFSNWTMLQALQTTGGTGLTGATKILLRAAVAAYLNAAHEGLGYPYRRFMEPGFIQQDVNAALASLDRATMLNLAADLDAKNNLGCPLS